ncbi:dTDP-glucose 4,6-dehydratase [Pontibacter sp. JH31]|uniref:dTDP-glucose 4,6-dehydratase n=1 Tax=Pontibacter aquaedesilientis TaxID=2766980 RepID=A0ABR7XL31_9BACT|nr:dTDP-glucose 4,6-dehydratase [Pontibacter aquaedesilientis]MBD1398999.1 dTDP-glucose 4,6-dehydratase [Pontibacter aquaedesilientis]
MNLLITGGAGFIGSHVVRLFVETYPQYNIFNLDALTYAGNLQNLRDVEDRENYTFLKGDITDAGYLEQIFQEHKFEAVIHLAAESHVDRSISGPMAFVQTNVIGTVNLLEACRRAWAGQYEGRLFYHVSTDEVYGSLGAEGLFTEQTAYDPRSPYSASKAASDHFVRAWHHTYGLPVKLSNCSNNYGPNHFPEKLIPLSIHNIKTGKPVPVYGKGENVRDWLYVLDHARAIDAIFHSGKVGETYNVGGVNEWRNIDLIELLCDVMDEKLGREAGSSRKLIAFVQDRPGHDARYAIDSSKLMNELGWKPSVTFEEGLRRTVDWYLENGAWLELVTSGHYRDYYRKQYEQR